MSVLAASALDEVIAQVFLDIALIIVVARLMGALFQKIRQPAVVGEIVGGIALGPSLLGLLPGDLTRVLFPTEVRPLLGAIAQLGLIVFMFIVGLELDVDLIKGKERLAAVISVTSVALPFGLGIVLASSLHPLHATVEGFPRVEFLPFALFLGAAMSITAFPVLARILTDRNMYRTPIGALTMACAAVDDILAWSLLAVVIAIAQATSLATLPLILALTLLYVAVMFLVVRPLLGRVVARYRRAGKMTPDILAVVLVGILVSSYTTNEIGIHSIFGAFMFGVVMPRRDTAPFFHDILERLEHMTVLLLLPVFFVATGLNVDIGGLGLEALPQLGAILLVAIVGKFAGATIAARARGVPAQQAAAIGVLMNTRGLTELVILNVGASIGVLDPRLFTMMVIMAVLTTVMTEPLLRLVYPDKQLERDIAEAQQAALGIVEAYKVLVAVGDPAEAERLCDIAVAAVGDEHPAEIVLARFVAYAAGQEITAGLATELAAMARSNAALNALAAAVQARGVPCTVVGRLSDDVAGDLLAQSLAVRADVLLVDSAGQPAFLQRLTRHAACDVVIAVDAERQGLRSGAERQLVLVAGDRLHDAAALEFGVRVARGLGVGALLVSDPACGRRQQRRTAAILEEARPLGVPLSATVAEPALDAALARLSATAVALVAGIRDDGFARAHWSALSGRASSPLLVVSSPDDAVRGGLGELARTLARQREREAQRTT